MRVMLDQILNQFIVLGRLTVRWPDGSNSTYGGTPGPEAVIELRDARTVARIALNPSLAVGEAYMDGGLVAVDCPIYDVLDVLVASLMAEKSGKAIVRVRDAVRLVTRRIAQFNPAGRARRNVAHHYDLNGRLYSLFLDRDRQYSCAYFPRGDETRLRQPRFPQAAMAWSGRPICWASARRISILRYAQRSSKIGPPIYGGTLHTRCWRAWRIRCKTPSHCSPSWAFRSAQCGWAVEVRAVRCGARFRRASTAKPSKC